MRWAEKGRGSRESEQSSRKRSVKINFVKKYALLWDFSAQMSIEQKKGHGKSSTKKKQRKQRREKIVTQNEN